MKQCRRRTKVDTRTHQSLHSAQKTIGLPSSPLRQRQKTSAAVSVLMFRSLPWPLPSPATLLPACSEGLRSWSRDSSRISSALWLGRFVRELCRNDGISMAAASVDDEGPACVAMACSPSASLCGCHICSCEGMTPRKSAMGLVCVEGCAGTGKGQEDATSTRRCNRSPRRFRNSLTQKQQSYR